MKHRADLILRGLGAGVAGGLCVIFASGIVITSEARNLPLFVHATAAGEKKQIPHGLNFTPTSAKTALVGDPVRPFVMTTQKSRNPTLLYTAPNKVPGCYGRLGRGPFDCAPGRP